MTGGRHTALIAVSVTTGLVALVSLWMVLDPIATGRLPWLPGGALGIAGTAVYVAGGGRSLQSAVSASMLGSAFVTCAVVTLILIGGASEMPLHEVLLLAPFLLLWALLPAAILLVIPATVGTLVVFASARLARGWKP